MPRCHNSTARTGVKGLSGVIVLYTARAHGEVVMQGLTTGERLNLPWFPMATCHDTC